jgi:hypothetical protein
MSTAHRLQQKISTIGVLMTGLDGRTYRSIGRADPITGLELAQRIDAAVRLRDNLNASIEAMTNALDHGETVEEREARIAAEDADPKAAAQKHGWYSIEDFALLCDPGDDGFRRRIASCKGQIVKPTNEATCRRLLGTGWAKYPERGEYWADWFDFADNWTDALKKAREAQREVA